MLQPKNETRNNDTFISSTGDIFDVINSVVTLDELWNILHDHVSTLGLTSFTYYHMPPAGSRDYDTHYYASRGKNLALLAAQKSAIFDPIESFIPVVRRCNTVTVYNPNSTYELFTEAQENLFKTLHMSDLIQGFVVPVHSARGRSGCFVLEIEDKDLTFPVQIIRQITWICQAAHTKYCQIRQQNSKSIKQLTARERQILTWVARGKSNSVIADIIGISQHTVNGYLRSIYLKTGTSDRTTAALRGIGETLIDL